MTFGILAPFILRVTVGIYFFHTGYNRLQSGELDSVANTVSQRLGTLARPIIVFSTLIEISVGLLLIAGLFTQIAALIGIVCVLRTLWFTSKYPAFKKHEKVFYFMVLAILFSLLLIGAGAFAVDLPL